VLATLLRPRWLGLTGLLAVILVSFTLLGLWQLDVARDEARRQSVADAPTRPVTALHDVLAPHREFPASASGRRVEATGSYDPAGQVLVAGRRLDGATGYWVVTPLVVDGTGARLAVLRGFTRSGSGPSPRTTSPVTVLGTLAPGESPARSDPLPEGQLASLDLGLLANRWPGEIYNAFVFVVSETPDATGAGPPGTAAAGGLERVPPPRVPSGLTLRNAAYALQWWVFALFATWMWWKMVRADHRDRAAARTPDPLPAPAGDRAS